MVEMRCCGCQDAFCFVRNAVASVFEENEICTVRIELRGSRPLIWREVEVPTAVTLKALHDIIQAAMGWLDYHLWEFTIGQQRFGLPIEEDWGAAPRIPAAKVKLREVLTPRRTIITYTYDFGDDWEHRLTVTGIRQGEPEVGYPRYIAGERNAPPEDSGGLPGFYDKLAIATDANDLEHEEIKEWLGGYDPAFIDEMQVRLALGRIAKRRSATRLRRRKLTT